jgi:hypothetical protein
MDESLVFYMGIIMAINELILSDKCRHMECRRFSVFSWDVLEFRGKEGKVRLTGVVGNVFCRVADMAEVTGTMLV